MRQISPEFIERALTRLGCTVRVDAAGAVVVGADAAAADGAEAAGAFRVVPPSFRPDLRRIHRDFKEVLRLWGMDRVEATIPAAKNHIGGLTHDQRLLRRVGAILRSCGLNETTTYSFAAPGDLEKTRMSTEGRSSRSSS